MKPVPHGEPYAGKLHVRFDEGAGVPDNKGRPALLYFAVGDNEITGVVEVGAVSSDGAEYPGKLGPNATVTLLGTNDLGQDFKVICSVTTDNAGRFRLATPKDCQFFKLKLTVEEVVE